MAARNEPDMDPEVADRVLRQLYLRTRIMPESAAEVRAFAVTYQRGKGRTPWARPSFN